MKKIIIYTDTPIMDITDLSEEKAAYTIKIVSSDKANNQNLSGDKVLINCDDDFDIQKITSFHKKNDTVIWAYTQNTTRENILRLYSFGVNNVIPTPKSFTHIINILLDPENEDVSLSIVKKTEKSKKKILILDDTKANNELLEATLDEFNFAYYTYTDPKEALIEIEKISFDLIILDIMMPEIDGFHVAQKIRNSSLNSATPFIFITSMPGIEAKIKGYEVGSYSYIERPYNIDVVRAQVKNVLEIVELQDNLCRENELQKSMLEYSNNQSIITDASFMILSAGNQHISLNKGEYFFSYFKANAIEYPIKQLADFVQSKERTFKFIFDLNAPEEQIKTYESSITKILSASNETERFLIVIEDITDRILLEQQKETFVATLTHDLKSPVRAEYNVLKQLIDLKYGDLTSEQKEILTQMLDSRAYMQRMVDNLLTRYKINAENFVVTPELNSYKQTIENTVRDLKYLAQNKSQTIYVGYNSEIDDFYFDKTEIVRVLVNIIVNASEYTPNGGEIYIKVQDAGKYIKTSITDTGYGLSEKDIPLIFNKHVTLAKKYRKVGSGLGLYISKSIIESHGGEIRVESKLNEGSKFEFTIPLSMSEKNMDEELIDVSGKEEIKLI